MEQNRQKHTKKDRNLQKPTETERNRQKHTQKDRNGPKQKETDKNRQKQREKDRKFGRGLTSMANFSLA